MLLHLKISEKVNSCIYLSNDNFLRYTQQWRHTAERKNGILTRHDYKLIRANIRQIMELHKGQSTTVPLFDPQTGLAIDSGEVIEIRKSKVLLFDSTIHFNENLKGDNSIEDSRSYIKYRYKI